MAEQGLAQVQDLDLKRVKLHFRFISTEELVALYRLTLVAPEAPPAHANWSGLLVVPKFFDGEQVDRRWRPRSPLGNLNNLERDDFGGRIGLCT